MLGYCGKPPPQTKYTSVRIASVRDQAVRATFQMLLLWLGHKPTFTLVLDDQFKALKRLGKRHQLRLTLLRGTDHAQ